MNVALTLTTADDVATLHELATWHTDRWIAIAADRDRLKQTGDKPTDAQDAAYALELRRANALIHLAEDLKAAEKAPANEQGGLL